MSNLVFFPDNENFKARNFPMVHRLIREFGFQTQFDEPPKQKEINFFLKGQRQNFVDAVIENRFIFNIDLFEIVASEYQRYINIRSLTEKISFNWADILNEQFESVDRAALKKLLEYLNDAIVSIEYYREMLFRKRPFLVFVFGGAKIYQRACLKICEIYNLNTFVLEHFFTGKHVYIEPQFTQIQNNSTTIKRISTRAKKEAGSLMPVNIKLSNINVKAQPNTDFVDEILGLKEDEQIGCIFLQVFDDYSLANVADDYVLSDNLDSIVELALKENDCVIIKLHPFEYTKHGRYRTQDYLENKFFDELRLGRIYFVEGMLDEQLQRINKWYGIVSQYALNLTLLGISPNYHESFFFSELFNGLGPYEKILLLHELTEHGFFDHTEKSYARFLNYLSVNLLPSVGCSETDITAFNNKMYEISTGKKFVVTSNSKVVTSNSKNSSLNKQSNRNRKIRNAIRLLVFDPRTFRVKLFAKLGL